MKGSPAGTESLSTSGNNMKGPPAGKKYMKGAPAGTEALSTSIFVSVVLCIIDYGSCRKSNTILVYVCVLHIKPFFLPVDIQHSQSPCRFFLLERCKFCGHKTTTEILHCNAVSIVDNAMTREKNERDKETKKNNNNEIK